MTSIAFQRLHNQQLVQTKFSKPEEVVAWLGAVQSQEYAGAKWALYLRTHDITDDNIEQAFISGAILRTHVMRPTWHFVAAADIRWILELTAPRVHAINAHYYRKAELDEAILKRNKTVLTKALQGGKQLTRTELALVLAESGIVADGLRLSYLMMHAELDGLICSGARRGKQFTYALLEERAPQARTLNRDEALAELTRRYFTSHGPATVEDFAWWSGLTKANVKIGLEMVKPDIVQEVIEGKSYWLSPSTPQLPKLSHRAFLLPTYDEFVIGYTDRSAMFDTSQAENSKPTNPIGNTAFDSMILIDSQVVGTWRRTFGKGTVIIEAAPFQPFTQAQNDAFAVAAQRFSEYLGMPMVMA